MGKETTVALSNGTTDDHLPVTTSLSLQMGIPNAPFVICRISNGHISATIHFMFGSTQCLRKKQAKLFLL